MFCLKCWKVRINVKSCQNRPDFQQNVENHCWKPLLTFGNCWKVCWNRWKLPWFCAVSAMLKDLSVWKIVQKPLKIANYIQIFDYKCEHTVNRRGLKSFRFPHIPYLRGICRIFNLLRRPGHIFSENVRKNALVSICSRTPALISGSVPKRGQFPETRRMSALLLL